MSVPLLLKAETMKIKNLHSYYHLSAYHNEDLIEVYKDTVIKALNYPFGYTTTVLFGENLKSHYHRKKGEFFVENIDSVGALVKYGENSKVGVLNMASAKTPGGGVLYGSKAQEEALFRCSNLSVSISKSLYPLPIDQVLVTENAIFFKDKDYHDLEDAHVATVITCAAPKLEAGDLDWCRNDYDAIINMKMELILNAALKYNVETLILGAWGCGVYKNDPTYIATQFLEHLKRDNRHYCYDRIVFAVINDGNSVGNNYEIFKSIIG